MLRPSTLLPCLWRISPNSCLPLGRQNMNAANLKLAAEILLKKRQDGVIQRTDYDFVCGLPGVGPKVTSIAFLDAFDIELVCLWFVIGIVHTSYFIRYSPCLAALVLLPITQGPGVDCHVTRVSLTSGHCDSAVPEIVRAELMETLDQQDWKHVNHVFGTLGQMLGGKTGDRVRRIIRRAAKSIEDDTKFLEQFAGRCQYLPVYLPKRKRSWYTSRYGGPPSSCTAYRVLILEGQRDSRDNYNDN